MTPVSMRRLTSGGTPSGLKPKPAADNGDRARAVGAFLQRAAKVVAVGLLAAAVAGGVIKVRNLVVYFYIEPM